MINEEKLFKLLPYFFDRPSAVLLEIAQNAHRSVASRLDITLKGAELEVEDDGSGTDNPQALVCLAESDWPSEVMENQMPAGWGLFFLMSISETLSFTSLFGTLKIDCKRFLNDASYRDGALSLVDDVAKTERGFRIKAHLIEGVFKSVAYLQVLDGLAYFPMNITVNGGVIKKKRLSDSCKNYPIKTSYMGNVVYINPNGGMFLRSVESFLGHVSLVWYGMPLNVTGYLHDVAIDVREGDPLTPVLPYRTSIKHDEKAQRFLEFVRKEVAAWCMEQIRAFERETSQDMKDTVRIMKLAGELLSSEELDGLNLFFVEVVDPYHTESTDADEVIRHRLVRRGEGPLVSEQLALTVNNELAWDEGDEEKSSLDITKPILPPWTITRIDLPTNRPIWLRKVERPVCIRVTSHDSIRYGYTWHQSSMECEGKEIAVVSTIEGWAEGDIYYANGPEDFLSVEDAVFDMKIYNDDGDTYDTQRDSFSRFIAREIMSITGKYPLSDLIGGIRVTGIYPHEVQAINIDLGERVMKVTKTNGEILSLELLAA
jgi:hypothetical protein